MTDTPTPERGEPETCERCGKRSAGVHTCVPYAVQVKVLWEANAQLRAECARLQAYADKLAEGLPMLPNDIALMQAGNAEMATTLNAIDAACLKACPDNSAETMGEPDADVGRYLCMSENGDELIDTDDPAEVVERLYALWGRVSDRCESLATEVARKDAEIAAVTERSQYNAWKVGVLTHTLRVASPIHTLMSVDDMAARYNLKPFNPGAPRDGE